MSEWTNSETIDGIIPPSLGFPDQIDIFGNTLQDLKDLLIDASIDEKLKLMRKAIDRIENGKNLKVNKNIIQAINESL
jgi:hypothetical protein